MRSEFSRHPRSYSQFFRPVKAIVRTDEANSMALFQRKFLPSNDTYKTKTSAGNTLNFIRGNENVTHSAQGETVFLGEIFCLEYPSTRSEKGNVHFANYRFSFRKLQIFISQTTDFHFVSSHFVSFHFISQTTVSPSGTQRHLKRNHGLECPLNKTVLRNTK